MKTFLKSLLLVCLFPVSAQAQDADCKSFPRPSGGKFEMTDKGFKVIVIASESVRFDDIDVVNTAREKAEMKAKAQITKFMEEAFSSEAKLKEATAETASIGGESVKASYDKLSQTAKAYRSNSAAVLRGVAPLDECYTPGKELRVMYGIKPETLAAAGAMAGAINKSLNQNPTRKPGSGDASAGKSASKSPPQDTREALPLNRVDGYGGSRAMERF